MNEIHLQTARLLTRIAPLVLVDDTFALKGGTAINLFVRDMPRLSVDLDLVLPDHTLSREQELRRITDAIHQFTARLKKQGFQTHAPASVEAGGTKLLVRQGAIQVKIEVNFVLRGAFPTRLGTQTSQSAIGLRNEQHTPDCLTTFNVSVRCSRFGEGKCPIDHDFELAASRLID